MARLVENRTFCLLHLYLAPRCGDRPYWNFSQVFRVRKLEFNCGAAYGYHADVLRAAVELDMN